MEVKKALSVLAIAVLVVGGFLLFMGSLQPIGTSPPTPAMTDLEDPDEVRQDLRESVVHLLTNICLGGGQVTQICVEGQTATGENAGICLPVDCELTYGIEGDRQ